MGGDLKPGREMDARVAEQVMEERLDWKHVELLDVILRHDQSVNDGRGIYVRCSGCGIHGYGNLIAQKLADGCLTPCCKPYSTDIAAAWEVVEKLKLVTLLERQPSWCDHLWAARFLTEEQDEDIGWGEGATFADTAPHAICLAALKAVGESTDG